MATPSLYVRVLATKNKGYEANGNIDHTVAEVCQEVCQGKQDYKVTLRKQLGVQPMVEILKGYKHKWKDHVERKAPGKF